MAVKIAGKIVGYKVQDKAQEAASESAKPVEKPPVSPEQGEATPPRIEPVLVEMSENVARPELLRGTTYKIKTPISEHAMYVTINDMVLNEGTPYETRQPFEIFINSKNLEHYQWIVALTRVISAVFRKGGDVAFLAEELQAVFDPKGGYWQKGKFMPSLVAELGAVLDRHMRELGMIKPSELAEQARRMIAEKTGRSNVVELKPAASVEPAVEAIPPHAMSFGVKSTQTCPSCGFGGLIKVSGCEQCPDCGYSRCG
jgi:hypothetical protein